MLTMSPLQRVQQIMAQRGVVPRRAVGTPPPPPMETSPYPPTLPSQDLGLPDPMQVAQSPLGQLMLNALLGMSTRESPMNVPAVYDEGADRTGEVLLSLVNGGQILDEMGNVIADFSALPERMRQAFGDILLMEAGAGQPAPPAEPTPSSTTEV